MNSGNLKISHVTDVWVSMASQIPGIGTQVTAVTVWEKKRHAWKVGSLLLLLKVGRTLLSLACCAPRKGETLCSL